MMFYFLLMDSKKTKMLKETLNLHYHITCMELNVSKSIISFNNIKRSYQSQMLQMFPRKHLEFQSGF
jgi:hypothetical protein